MHVVVEHRITDSEKFASIDAGEIGGGGPPGSQVRQFFPYKDGSAAICLWETQSLDALRDYLDPAPRPCDRELVLRGRWQERCGPPGDCCGTRPVGLRMSVSERPRAWGRSFMRGPRGGSAPVREAA